MISASSNISPTAITENLLKRKWSSAILRYLEDGATKPKDIAKYEPSLSAPVMNERLRTLVRYGLVTRTAKPVSAGGVEYYLTTRGKKVLRALEIISQLDDETLDEIEGKGTLHPGRTPTSDCVQRTAVPNLVQSPPISIIRNGKAR